jgi:iron complex outermembrane receptor protein
MKGRSCLLVILLAVFSAAYQIAADPSEDPEDLEVYRLPDTEVSAERDTPEYIGRDEMDRDDAQDLWQAVQYVPGVILSGGGRRNDSNFTIRGFGVDSVPVFVDGIVMANPYRGEGDSARLLSGDLESIEIQKGYSSLLLGANTMGGAIVMRTAKPIEAFEASVKTGIEIDSAGSYGSSAHVFSAGTRQEYFYAKGVFQYRDTDHFRLPGSFEPTPNNPQKKGNRLWSDSRDLKLTFLTGWTPVSTLDLWLTWVYQDAEKGFSPPETETGDYQIWHWPLWNRQSVSLNGSFSAGTLSADALFYFDKYDNRLDEYRNQSAYELGIHAPHSDYDEYSTGGRLTGRWDINRWNNLQAALTYTKEDHRGLRGSIDNEDKLSEEMHVNEDTWSVGMEYSLSLCLPLTLKAGFGFDALVPIAYWNRENEYLKLLDAGYFIVKTRSMFLYTGQFGIFYALPFGVPDNRDHELHFTYARKNHFPDMAQRYSTRFGTTLPNPNLGPEKAHHLELGYRGYFGGILNLSAAMYYSIITGKIVTIELGNPHYPGALVDYARNLDSTGFWGFELGAEFNPEKCVSGGISFSVNKYRLNHSQADVKVIPYYPAVTFSVYGVIKPVRILSIVPRLGYTGSRFADSMGQYTLKGYLLGSLKAEAEITNHVALSAGVDNILDTLYEISRRFPMAGRSYTINFSVRY